MTQKYFLTYYSLSHDVGANAARIVLILEGLEQRLIVFAGDFWFHDSNLRQFSDRMLEAARQLFFFLGVIFLFSRIIVPFKHKDKRRIKFYTWYFLFVILGVGWLFNFELPDIIKLVGTAAFVVCTTVLLFFLISLKN